MPLSVDLEVIRSLAALRDAGVAEAEFREDGTISRARFTPATAPGASRSPETTEAEPRDAVLEARRSNYENLFNRHVPDDELKRLP